MTVLFQRGKGMVFPKKKFSDAQAYERKISGQALSKTYSEASFLKKHNYFGSYPAIHHMQLFRSSLGPITLFRQ